MPRSDDKHWGQSEDKMLNKKYSENKTSSQLNQWLGT